MTTRFPFSSFPVGWFRVAGSRDVRNGEVKHLQYFGQDLVLFRTAKGTAHVLNGHCPHLGAPLWQGRVQGEAVRCPFHHWCIDGNGQCVEIPYARKIPPQARTKSWPVQEINGAIMLWHHPRGEAPDWEFPTFPDQNAPLWSAPRPSPRVKLRTHVQEVLENGVDVAHMSFLHGRSVLECVSESAIGEGHSFRAVQSHGYAASLLQSMTLKSIPRGKMTVHYHGLGCAVARIELENAPIVQAIDTFNFSTPIDEEHIILHAEIRIKTVVPEPLRSLLARMVGREMFKENEPDFPIWSEKAYHKHPVLCDGDGPIMKFRAWAGQFYPETRAQAPERRASPSRISHASVPASGDFAETAEPVQEEATG